MNCIFCHISPEKYLVENEYFFAIRDIHPITKGHSLIISRDIPAIFSHFRRKK